MERTRRFEMTHLFEVPRPVIATVHLDLKKNQNELLVETVSDLIRLQNGGVNGLLFQNWGAHHKDRFGELNVRENMTSIIEKSNSVINVPFGISILPAGYEASFDIASKTRAQFVHLDTFVDSVRWPHNEQLIVNIDPKEVIKYRKGKNSENVFLFASIQSKHFIQQERGKKLELSALEAAEGGADAIVVTGGESNESPSISRIKMAKRFSAGTPVLIGSGVDKENLEGFLLRSDGAIAEKAFRVRGSLQNKVDIEKTQTLMAIARRVNDTARLSSV
jgi:uncharacterized protein